MAGLHGRNLPAKTISPALCAFLAGQILFGTFTAEKDGFTGTLRTLTLNVKVKLVPNDKGENESAPDFRLQAAGHDFGAAWKKTSEAGRDYLSVAIDDPSFPATVYARLIEGENGTHDLIWSRSKPKAA